jgi:hypothetical protein
MNTECNRIADQLRRAFSGDPWHGPPLREILAGITAEQARARPLPSTHNIWELVLHIGLESRLAIDATRGIAMPKLYGTELDWPAPGEGNAAWSKATEQLFIGAEQLAQSIESFGDARLQDTVPGRDYDFYYLFHGIVQHGLYHGGQMAMLKKQLSTVK